MSEADLEDEVLNDPLVRGYNGTGSENAGPGPMTDAQVSASLHAVNRPRNRTSMSGDEVFLSIASRADWDALTVDDRLLFTAFCGRDNIDPFGGANEELVKSIFGDASATINNLNNARVETISRVTERSLGKAGAGIIKVIRRVI